MEFTQNDFTHGRVYYNYNDNYYKIKLKIQKIFNRYEM